MGFDDDSCSDKKNYSKSGRKLRKASGYGKSSRSGYGRKSKGHRSYGSNKDRFSRDIDAYSDSERSERESKHKKEKENRRNNCCKAKKHKDEEYKRHGTCFNNKCAKKDLDKEANQFNKKNQHIVKEADKSNNRMKKVCVRKFYEKSWEEKAHNSEDERCVKNANNYAKKHHHAQQECNNASNQGKKALLQKDNELSAFKASQNNAKNDYKDFKYSRSESEKSVDRFQDDISKYHQSAGGSNDWKNASGGGYSGSQYAFSDVNKDSFDNSFSGGHGKSNNNGFFGSNNGSNWSSFDGYNNNRNRRNGYNNGSDYDSNFTWYGGDRSSYS